ncbi:MAG: asparagine synthase (glutamine-hydrolyzing) [Solirubrobacterales bacterium]
MCGIAGAVSRADLDPGVLPRMADAIRHRGPDGEGYLLHAPKEDLEFHRTRETLERSALRDRARVGFAHRRLSIIDLSDASAQPMIDASGELAIAYNGELYNYLELRDELGALGHEFRTSGDTEVVLNAYAEWGPDCLERMVGMWAMAILDLRRRTVFLTVDRFGIKPLFYTSSGETLFFASEIKALAAIPGIRIEPYEPAVRRFLSVGRVDETRHTFFDRIFRLEAGHSVSISLDRPEQMPATERYWTIPSRQGGLGVADAAESLAARLTESIRVHARSDVPVGTCLSGGLDSSAIVCIADRLRRSGAVPHYAHVGFGYLPEDPTVSEREYMDAVVKQTSIEMTYIEVPAERFRSSLVGIIAQQDEPFVSTSQAAQWFVFERARQAGLKVMLDGQGADEVLGGYHGYFQLIALALLRSGHPVRYLRFNREHRRRFGEPPIPARRAVAAAVPRRALRRLRGVPNMTVKPMLSPGLTSAMEPADYGTPVFHSINEILEAYTRWMNLPALLRYEDRNSMAHSIEARVPFLDHRLVELAFSLPGDYKISGVQTKRVLRDALRGIIPEKIRARTDKVGFRAEPSVTWALAEAHRESLSTNLTAYEREWFNPTGVRDFIDGSNRSDNAEFTLWRVLNTKLWLRAFWA